MKNSLFRLLLALIPKRKFQRKNQERLLVVSTTGLGDSLWGSPAIKALRKKHPKGYIALLTSPIGEQVFKNNPHLDELFTIKRLSFFSSFRLLFLLRKRQFDTAYIFHFSQRPVLPIVSLAGPSKIIGTLGINKGLDWLLTTSIKQKNLHEIERRLELVDCLNACPKLEIFLTKEEKKLSFDDLLKASLLIGMHPGAKNRFKQWNPNHFIALGKKLFKEKKATTIITGNVSETLLAQEIAKEIPGAISLAGKLSLRALAAVIEKFDLFITNDTGPMHLSFALEIPTFCLFAPTDPLLCGPYKTKRSYLIQRSRCCAPCMQKKCASPFCMEQISPSMVYQLIETHLSNQ